MADYDNDEIEGVVIVNYQQTLYKLGAMPVVILFTSSSDKNPETLLRKIKYAYKISILKRIIKSIQLFIRQNGLHGMCYYPVLSGTRDFLIEQLTILLFFENSRTFSGEDPYTMHILEDQYRVIDSHSTSTSKPKEKRVPDHPFLKRIQTLGKCNNFDSRFNTRHATKLAEGLKVFFKFKGSARIGYVVLKDMFFENILKIENPHVPVDITDFYGNRNMIHSFIVNPPFNFSQTNSTHSFFEIYTIGYPDSKTIKFLDDDAVFELLLTDHVQDEISINAITDLSGFLMCPLSSSRMEVPVIGCGKCSKIHPRQYFDYESFKMTKTFNCPVCSEPLKLSELRRSKYLTKLIGDNALNDDGDDEYDSDDSDFSEEETWEEFLANTAKKSTVQCIDIDSNTNNGNIINNVIYIISDDDE